MGSCEKVTKTQEKNPLLKEKLMFSEQKTQISDPEKLVEN
jgi:hypothetical protein